MKLSGWISLGAVAGLSACSTMFGDFLVLGVGTGGAGGESTTTATGATTTTAAGTACTSDSDCATGFGCSPAGMCLLLNGRACTAAGECLSTFCVDGACCDTACSTACQACSAALTGGTNGTCTNATDGTKDPRGICVQTAVTSCGTDGKCGGGACEDWPGNTVCALGTCENGAQPNFQYVQLCNGSGQCATYLGPYPPRIDCTSVMGCSSPSTGCACDSDSDCPTAIPTCTKGACGL